MRFGPEWSCQHPLSDGSIATVRTVSPQDKPLFERAAREFSADAMTRRFFSPKPRFNSTELQYLTEVDGQDHFARVAVRTDPSGHGCQGLGAARFIRDRDTQDEAEFAVIVGDAWQHAGLGTALLENLVAAAWERGVTTFKGDTLSTNYQAFHLVDRLAPGADWITNGIIANVRFRLDPLIDCICLSSGTRKSDI